MRIALISDIHGHDTALEAVLDDINRQSVEALICLGDVATIGPQPRQALARLRKTGCACVLGNHDAALLDPQEAPRYQIAPLLLSSLAWCTRQLTAEDTDYVRSFRPLIELTLGPGATLMCFHGAPGSTTALILATTPGEVLDQYFAAGTATLMAGGHSHIQMTRHHAGSLIVNPGSVGSAFGTLPAPGAVPILLPWAEYGIVSWERGALSVELRRVPFDRDAFWDAVSKSDIPIQAWWLQQYRETAPASG